MLYVMTDEEFYYEHSVNQNIYVEYCQRVDRRAIEKLLHFLL